MQAKCLVKLNDSNDIDIDNGISNVQSEIVAAKSGLVFLAI